MNLSLNQFVSLLEEKYGQSLKPQARIGAKDFWKYLENIKDGILSDEIDITIDMFSIARAFPEYASHQTWKGLSILFLIVAVPLFFYNWIFGALSIVVGIAAKVVGSIFLRSNGQRIVGKIVDGIRKNDLNSGLGSLCAYYLSGMVQLSSAKGYSRWPHFPSNVITGIQATVEEEGE
jgi:hypothetical protein